MIYFYWSEYVTISDWYDYIFNDTLFFMIDYNHDQYKIEYMYYARNVLIRDVTLKLIQYNVFFLFTVSKQYYIVNKFSNNVTKITHSILKLSVI